MAGHPAPKIENACELGFGQGLSVAIHAAAQSGIKWWGADFNPSQASFATELAQLSGSDAKLTAQRFHQLFWMNKNAGGKTPADWAGFVWPL